MASDVIIYDIFSGMKIEMSIKPITACTFYIPISGYFPFTCECVENIHSLDSDIYALGVGYASKDKKDHILDIQIGVSGSVNINETFIEGLVRELAEETALDISTAQSLLHVDTYFLYDKTWHNFWCTLSPKSSLTSIQDYRKNSTRTKRGASVLVTGKLEWFTRLYDDIIHSEHYASLKNNMDNVRFIALFNGDVLRKIKFKNRSINWNSRHNLCLFVTYVNGIPIDQFNGRFLGLDWHSPLVKLL